MGKPGAELNQATNTGVSVGTSTTPVIAANSKRHGLIIVNDGANVVYLSFGTGAAVAGTGVRLNALGGVIQLDSNALWIGAVQAIAVGGSSNITVCEYSA